jgi:ketosteroid isomerase-like protein
MKMSATSGRTIRWLTVWMMLALLSAPAFAQNTTNKKNKKNSSDASTLPAPPVPVPEEIDHDIGEMLGAWQVGNVEAMHKYYDEDVTVVSGAFEPPIVGWANYAVSYQKMHDRIQEMQFVRKNTVIRSRGDLSWATYQWEFYGTIDHMQTSFRGQTSLVFSKVGDRWLIVHNHSSQVCDQQGGATPQTPPKSPPAQ